MAKVKVKALTSTAGNYGFKTAADEPFDMEEADAKRLEEAGTVEIQGKWSEADEKKAAKEDRVNIVDNTQKANEPFHVVHQQEAKKQAATVNVKPPKAQPRKSGKRK